MNEVASTRVYVFSFALSLAVSIVHDFIISSIAASCAQRRFLAKDNRRREA
jgi:hypothetical protein